MMPTLQQFRYLVALSETLHFRRAAELTHVTQPTLSAQLRELEAKLGVQLVERSRSRVILTPIGEDIAARAQAILRDVGEITALARQGRGAFTGTIRVGVVQSLGSYFLPLVLPALHEAYPELKFYIREGWSQDLSARLEQGTLDLLFLPLPNTGADLEVEPLFEEPLLAVVSRDHALADQDHVDVGDLAGEHVMTLEPGHQLHEIVAEVCAKAGATLSLDYGGTSLDTLRQMVATGLGVSLLPALYVRSEVAREQLVVARPLRPVAPARDIGMVWRAQAARSQEFHAIASLIRTSLGRQTNDVRILGPEGGQG